MTDNPEPRARLHSTGPRVHYVLYPAEDNRLSGPFRSKRAAQAAVNEANAITEPTTELTRRSLGRRLAHELDARAGRGDLTYDVQTDAGRLVYVITPGPAWADPKPPTLRLTPGETADWLGLPITEENTP